jgi:hypothetical protein
MVALAMPTGSSGGRIDPEALALGTAFKATNGRFGIEPRMCPSSLLCMSFNVLWAGCLNDRTLRNYSYFAMIHDDICPQQGWLDILVDELEAHDADMVSAVVPIKEPTGVTSTGLDDTGNEWSPRRLTLKELWNMPETWSDPKLLLNSGIWVCRFDRDWCEKVYFEQQDRIFQLPDGQYAVATKSEDWQFSRLLRSLGCKLLVTRKVALEHERKEWHTRYAWGLWDRDKVADLPAGAVGMLPMGITPEREVVIGEPTAQAA